MKKTKSVKVFHFPEETWEVVLGFLIDMKGLDLWFRNYLGLVWSLSLNKRKKILKKFGEKRYNELVEWIFANSEIASRYERESMFVCNKPSEALKDPLLVKLIVHHKGKTQCDLVSIINSVMDMYDPPMDIIHLLFSRNYITFFDLETNNTFKHLLHDVEFISKVVMSLNGAQYKHLIQNHSTVIDSTLSKPMREILDELNSIGQLMRKQSGLKRRFLERCSYEQRMSINDINIDVLVQNGVDLETVPHVKQLLEGKLVIRFRNRLQWRKSIRPVEPEIYENLSFHEKFHNILWQVNK